MSKEKNRFEAKRWMDTAADDLDAARLMHTNMKYSHVCFLCQQSVEKAIKAIYYFNEEDPWGHSIVKLIEDIKYFDETLFNKISTLLDSARLLDRFYIPTRYPNGLPDIIPSKAFGEQDSASAIKICEQFISIIETTIK